MDYGRKKWKEGGKEKEKAEKAGRNGKKRPKKGRIDFLLVSCVFFLGVALLYINKRQRVFICVWLLAEDFPRNSDPNGMYKMVL